MGLFPVPSVTERSYTRGQGMEGRERRCARDGISEYRSHKIFY
jgi:hypothetical protein